MKLIKQRDVIREVVAAFARTFAQHMDNADIFPDGETPKQKLARLKALDLETCDAAAVDAIVGNPSWTWVECDECVMQNQAMHPRLEVVVEFERGEKSVRVCAVCMARALSQLGNGREEAQEAQKI